MTTANMFSRQSDAGSRARTTYSSQCLFRREISLVVAKCRPFLRLVKHITLKGWALVDFVWGPSVQ